MLTLHFAPNSRAGRIVWLLEELDGKLEIQVSLDANGIKKGARRTVAVASSMWLRKKMERLYKPLGFRMATRATCLGVDIAGAGPVQQGTHTLVARTRKAIARSARLRSAARFDGKVLKVI